MTYITIHDTADMSASFTRHTSPPHKLGAFGVLAIKAGGTTITLHVGPERFAWADDVAAFINAPVAQQVSA